LLKDRISLNDLRIKVNKVLENSSKNNVNIVAVSVKTSPDNIDNAKGVLMNVRSVVPEKLRPVGKVEEYGIDNKGEEIMVGGSNSSTIDMNADQIKEYLEDNNCSEMYVRQIFEIIRKKTDGQDEVQDDHIMRDIEKRFKNIRNTIDDMFRAHSTYVEKPIEKKKFEVLVNEGISRRGKDAEYLSIEEIAKRDMPRDLKNRILTAELEEKLNTLDGVNLLDKLKKYNSHKRAIHEAISDKIVVREEDQKFELVKTYRPDPNAEDPNIVKLQRYFKNDQETLEKLVNHFNANNLEFTDHNIVEFMEHRNSNSLNNHSLRR